MCRTPSWRGKQHIHQKLRCKTEKCLQNNTPCNNLQLYITTYYIDTGSTYCLVTALRYISTMSTCLQADGSSSISIALLQNTAAHKKQKFSDFYYKPEIYYRIHNSLLLAHILCQLNPINNPKLDFLSPSIILPSTQSADVFKAIIVTHFPSPLCFPHALYFNSLHFIVPIQIMMILFM